MYYPFNHNIKAALNEEGIKIEALDYNGITVAFIDKLKIVERINARLPVSKAHGAIKVMLINGLGFTQRPIYLSHHFF